MGSLTYFHAQAYNNAWANHRLLKACGQLSQAELDAKRTSFFPSIIHTLNHNYTVDWFYVSALEGKSVGRSAFWPPIPFPAIAELDHAQRVMDKRLIDFCSKLAPETLFTDVALKRDEWTQIEKVDRVLLHLFQHEVHHRGQIHAMLAGTRVAPPQLDDFFLDDEKERMMRREDFAELGFTEAAIWK
jgi:uncharacterized damage-inducible protein DinB